MIKSKYEVACEYLDKEIKSLTFGNYINPQASFPLNTKAVIYKRTGKIDSAKETFDKALFLRPNYFEALITYSTILASASHTMSKAFDLVARAMLLQPDNNIFNQLLPNYAKIFKDSEASLRKQLQERGKQIDLKQAVFVEK
jgi:tetratricopeptide (TPR) repeat protein